MITNNPSQLKTILENLKVNDLAFETGFALRQARKITATAFVTSFFQMMICGKFSLRLWATNLTRLTGSCISFQAVAKKLDYRQESFFHALFQKALMAKMHESLNFKVNGLLQSFRRVILEDSTCFKLPKGLFEFFPGPRLPHGRMASGRLQLRIDLTHHNFESIAIQSYCQNDLSFAKDILNTLQKGDLVIRDLGYWSIPAFAKIIQLKAFFLSRLRLDAMVICPSTLHPIDLVSFLKKKDRLGIHQVDTPVLLGGKDHIPVRLIAIKLNDDQAQKRRRMAKSQRHKDSPISEQAYYLMSWNLFVTNVESKVWDVQSVYKAYNLRWHIEMIFKCWKSNFNFTTFFRHCYGRNPVKPEIILLLILTWFALVYMPRFNSCANTVWNKYHKILSPFRFADFISTQLYLLLPLNIHKAIPQIAYHCCYDKRKDRLNHFEKTYMNFLS
jgi:hypothetical protein